MDHQLLNTLTENYEFRSTLLAMLRPMDIISLSLAIGLRITLPEKRRYMILWRQWFLNMKWVDTLIANKCTITIIGNDIGMLHKSIIGFNLDFITDKAKMIIAISETDSTIPRSYSQHQDILRAFDAVAVWDEIPGLDDNNHAALASKIDQSPASIQIYVVSLVEWTGVDINHLWSGVLSSQSPLAQYVSNPGTSNIWRTEWQLLKCTDEPFEYSPTSMHYVIEPEYISNYRPRLFAGPEGVCSIMVMKFR